MSRLPNLTAKTVVRALERGGFQRVGQKGSHLYLHHPVRDVITTVPMHPGDLFRPLMKQIIKQAGLTEDQFRELL
jgi:predicted RNA binding protein YcfA (HicA-like mRNA interferase family)